MKRSLALLIFFIVAAVIANIAQIAVSSAFATDGIALSQIQSQTQELEKSNTILAEKVYAQGSLTHIASAAATLGFAENKKQNLVLSAPAPLALR